MKVVAVFSTDQAPESPPAAFFPASDLDAAIEQARAFVEKLPFELRELEVPAPPFGRA